MPFVVPVVPSWFNSYSEIIAQVSPRDRTSYG